MKKFYQHFPEAFICYINNQTLTNVNQLKNFEEVVKRQLFRFGIDYLHPSYHREEVRNLISKFFKYEDHLFHNFNYFKSILNNEKNHQN